MKEPIPALDESEGDSTLASCNPQDCPRTRGAPRRSGRILVVDDEPLFALVITQQLCGAHEVDVASGGKEAVRLLLAGKEYDVILCDISMPEMHGLDVHEEVARARPDQAAHFVFMSSGVSDSVLRQRLAALPNLLLGKPFDGRRIEQIVDDYVQRPSPKSSPDDSPPLGPSVTTSVQ